MLGLSNLTRFRGRNPLSRKPKSDIELKTFKDSSDENLTYKELLEECRRLGVENRYLKDEFRKVLKESNQARQERDGRPNITVEQHQQLVADVTQARQERDGRPNITVAEYQQLVAALAQAQQERDERPNITVEQHQQLVVALAQAQQERDGRPNITVAEYQQLVAALAQARQERDERPDITVAEHQQLVADVTQARQERDGRPNITVEQHQQLVVALAQAQYDLIQVRGQLTTTIAERDARPPVLLVDYERRNQNYASYKSLIRAHGNVIRTATGKKIVLSPS